MPLIKCPECGAMVSDKATECPKCGFPMKKGDIAGENENKVKETEAQHAAPPYDYDIEPPRKKGKGKIVALVIVLLCVLAGGGYFAYEKFFANGGEDAIVELTPEFIAAVQQYEELGVFSEGMAPVKKGGKWGFINTKGEEAIVCQYDGAEPFSEGLAAVRKGDHWGYVNAKNEVAIPLQYEEAQSFSGGLAMARKGDLWGIINVKGEEVLPFSYNYIGDFSDGLAAVRKDEGDDCKWGYVSTTGELSIPVGISAAAVGSFSDGLAFVCVDYENFYVIDTSGKKVFGGKWSEPVEWEHGGSIADSPSLLPVYIDGKIYVPSDMEKYTAYDKTGRKGRTIGQKEMDKIDRQVAVQRVKTGNAYTVFSNSKSSTYDDYKWVEAVLGLKDTKGNVVIQPAYNMINNGTDGSVVEVGNGVVLVQLEEMSGDVNEGDNGMMASNSTYYYGYADLKGHDTFTRDVKERCAQSRRMAAQKMQEQQAQAEMERLRTEGPDWLQGAWRMEATDDYGNTIGYLYAVFNHGNCTTYISDQTVIENTYTVDGNSLNLDSGGHYQLDNSRKVVVGVNGKEWQKISDDTSYTPSGLSSSGSSSESNDNSGAYSFSSPYDVMDYVLNRTFHENETGGTLKIRENGIFLNGQCMTGAPQVTSFSTYNATISANNIPSGRVYFYINSREGTVRGSMGLDFH